MSAMLSDAKVYALANRASSNFSRQMASTKQDLRRLLAHAHLYDELDDYLTGRRDRRAAGDDVPRPEPASKTTQEYRSRIQEQIEDRSRGRAIAAADNNREKWNRSAECAVIDAEDDDTGQVSEKVHAVPSLSKPFSVSEERPAWSNSDDETIVSEIAVDSTDESDSGSESEATLCSDETDPEYDDAFDFDSPVVDRETFPSPASIPRPASPHPCSHADKTSRFPSHPGLDKPPSFGMVTNHLRSPAIAQS